MMRPAILRCIDQRSSSQFRHAGFPGSNINRKPVHLASAVQKMQPSRGSSVALPRVISFSISFFGQDEREEPMTDGMFPPSHVISG
jgi:hypothetical protein